MAISSFYAVPHPIRPDTAPAVQLQFMAVDPVIQRKGIGNAVLSEAIRRLKATGAILLWAHARDSALPFYHRFGFITAPGSESITPPAGRPHHPIALGLR